ncbi:MAG TPA: hypothetical protein VGI87_02655, partial [Solirubrobacteraceae bacterium]
MEPRAFLVAGLVAAGLLLASAPAGAVTITEFPIEPGSAAGAHAPRYIHPGPDGALWFTDGGSDYGIGRITTDGSFEPPVSTIVPPVDFVTEPNETVFWAGDGGYGAHTLGGGNDSVHNPPLF